MTRPATIEYERTTASGAASEIAANTQTGFAAAIARSVTTLGIALWVGSLAHLLLSVASLFAAFPKAISQTAVQGAPILFAATERVNLVIAAVTLAAAVAWNWLSPGRSRRWIAWLLAAAAMLAVAQRTIVSAKMDALRDAGLSGGDQFRTLHGVSSSQYLVQTGLLLTGTLLLPAALDRRSSVPSPGARGRRLG